MLCDGYKTRLPNRARRVRLPFTEGSCPSLIRDYSSHVSNDIGPVFQSTRELFKSEVEFNFVRHVSNAFEGQYMLSTPKSAFLNPDLWHENDGRADVRALSRDFIEMITG